MKSKKIGLLTLPIKHNYGGIIQLAALNSYLEQEGYEVIHLNKRFEVSFFKRIVRRLLKWNPLYFIYDFKNHAKHERYIKNINLFIKRELNNSTRNLYSSNEIAKKVRQLKLDTIVVGSDQVWRMLYIKDDYEDFFLSFVNAKDFKKIAYAASFGTSEWESTSKTSNVANLLKDFKAISVREDSGVNICENTFNIKNVQHVLDPTFLTETAYYQEIIDREYVSSKKIGLFSYVLDNSRDRIQIIQEVASRLELDISTIYLQHDLKDFRKYDRIKPSMGEWLYHFKNAEFIITDSFHGTVFSILYNKQFISIGNKSRGVTRFKSLLTLLGLSQRLVLSGDDDYLSILQKPIDYGLVNQALEKMKMNSKNFLKDALS